MLIYICSVVCLFNLIRSTTFDKWIFFCIGLNEFYSFKHNLHLFFALHCSVQLCICWNIIFSLQFVLNTQTFSVFVVKGRFIFYSSLYFNSKSCTVSVFEFLYISVLQCIVLLFTYLYSVQSVDMDIKTAD